MQCLLLELRLGAWALTPGSFPSASTSVFWRPMEYLQGTLAIWRTNFKKSLTEGSLAILPAPHVLRKLNQLDGIHTVVLGIDKNNKTWKSLILGDIWADGAHSQPSAPRRTTCYVTHSQGPGLLCSPSDCFPITLLPLPCDGVRSPLCISNEETE